MIYWEYIFALALGEKLNNKHIQIEEKLSFYPLNQVVEQL